MTGLAFNLRSDRIRDILDARLPGPWLHNVSVAASGRAAHCQGRRSLIGAFSSRCSNIAVRDTALDRNTQLVAARNNKSAQAR